GTERIITRIFLFSQRYKHIHCFLDNDKAETDTFQELPREYGMRICDASHIYNGHKDLNDYLCKQSGQPVQSIQPVKPVNREQQVQQPKKKDREVRMW
ncbi:MAG: toprim domain-containing protein, partial [Bacillus cereus]|nr:toprim domain-containing protein [Bacillus cereus]